MTTSLDRKLERAAREIAASKAPKVTPQCNCATPQTKCLMQPGARCRRHGFINSNVVLGSK